MARRPAAPTAFTGMEEVIELENAIRTMLPELKGNPDLRNDCRRIMRGRLGGGTRLGHLKRIVGELRADTERQQS